MRKQKLTSLNKVVTMENQNYLQLTREEVKCAAGHRITVVLAV